MKSVPQKLHTARYLTKPTSDKQYPINLRWWPLCGFWHCSLRKHFCSIISPTLTSRVPDTFQCCYWLYGFNLKCNQAWAVRRASWYPALTLCSMSGNTVREFPCTSKNIKHIIYFTTDSPASILTLPAQYSD